jgi:DNA-binding LytR/AlgR family response regulator
MSGKVKILIVEDESIVAMDLAMRLQKAGYEVVGMADNSDEALTLFKEDEPDLVLMDININGEKDGIETAKMLKKVREVPLIFLTAFSQSEYVNRAKEANPSAYLVKPFNNDSLYTSIEIAIHNFALLKHAVPVESSKDLSAEEASREPLLFFNNYFFVKNNAQFTKIAVADLLYVESDDNYIKLITQDKKITIRITLQTFADTIKHQHIVRVHRSFMVNLQNIDGFSDEEIKIGRTAIPIGRTYKDDFLKGFKYL